MATTSRASVATAPGQSRRQRRALRQLRLLGRGAPLGQAAPTTYAEGRATVRFPVPRACQENETAKRIQVFGGLRQNQNARLMEHTGPVAYRKISVPSASECRTYPPTQAPMSPSSRPTKIWKHMPRRDGAAPQVVAEPRRLRCAGGVLVAGRGVPPRECHQHRRTQTLGRQAVPTTVPAQLVAGQAPPSRHQGREVRAVLQRV